MSSGSCGLGSAVLLHREASLSRASLLTIYTMAVFNGQTPLPRQALLLKVPCPGCCSLIEMKLQRALLIFFFSERNPRLLLLPGSIQQLCDQPAGVSAKFTASVPSIAQLNTKEDSLALSQTLADRKPQLSYSVKWA